jgi:hypothetical protein
VLIPLLVALLGVVGVLTVYLAIDAINRCRASGVTLDTIDRIGVGGMLIVGGVALLLTLRFIWAALRRGQPRR